VRRHENQQRNADPAEQHARQNENDAQKQIVPLKRNEQAAQESSHWVDAPEGHD
jgi:hypothetical protein